MNNEITTKTITITKDKLIRDIAKNGRLYDIDTIRMIYNELENNIRQYLSMTTNEQNIKIKLFEGMTIQGEYAPEQTKVNNLTGKQMTISSRIKPKVNITRTYCQKLNSK
ncbi:MAG: HU family DNA-binding protein [Clostridia bacterium]|nr:HU family DNA-binding protein [Clostridia bacterium]MBQ9657314.1 HU family DNA-binding protein [Clostridia bacterium]